MAVTIEGYCPYLNNSMNVSYDLFDFNLQAAAITDSSEAKLAMGSLSSKLKLSMNRS